MATSNFPSSLDTTSALPASISDTASLNSPNHADMHEVTNDAIIEIEEKLGTGDTTASTGAVLIGTGSGASAWDTSPTFLGDVTVGVDGTGHDVKFFGDSASHYMLWDQSADELVLTSDSKLSFHDQGGGENIVASSNGHLEINAGTTLDLTAPTIDLNASTAVTVDGVLKISYGSSSAPAYTFDTDPDTGIYRAAADKVGIAGNIEMNTELAQFTTGGYATPRRVDNGETDEKQLKELVSSERFKKDIVDLPKEEAYKILDARPIKYRGVDDDSSVPLEAGLSAESLHEAGYKYAVRYDEGHWGTTPRNIYYDMLVAPLITIVKDLNTRLAVLEG